MRFETLIWTFLVMWITAGVGGETRVGTPEAAPDRLAAADGGSDTPPPPPTGP